METALTIYVLGLFIFYFSKKFKPDDIEMYEFKLVFWGLLGLFLIFAIFTIAI